MSTTRPSKAAILLAVGVIVAVATFVLARPPQGPLIQVFPANLTRQVPADGKPFEASFRVSNVGDRPLIIKNVIPSCGCSVASISAKTVVPGGSATIRVSVVPIGAGKKTVDIDIASNAKNAASTTVKLQIEGRHALPYVERVDEHLNVGELKAGRNEQQLVLVTREPAGSKQWIGRARTDNVSAEVFLQGVDEMGYTEGAVTRHYVWNMVWKLEELDPSATTSNHQAPLSTTIQFTDPANKSVIADIKVTGHRRLDWIAVPSAIEPSTVKRGQQFVLAVVCLDPDIDDSDIRVSYIEDRHSRCVLDDWEREDNIVKFKFKFRKNYHADQIANETLRFLINNTHQILKVPLIAGEEVRP